MQGAENWFTGRDLDFFHYAVHACCQGGLVGKQPLLVYIFLKTYLLNQLAALFYGKTFCLLLTVTAALSNEFCCPSLELDDRGQMFTSPMLHTVLYDVYQQMGRWPALLPGPGCAEAQMEQQEQMGARRMRGGWDRDVCLIFNQWSSMLLQPERGRIKSSHWCDTDYGDVGIHRWKVTESSNVLLTFWGVSGDKTIHFYTNF